MDAALRASERRDFRAFLLQHRYAPQGRLLRAGSLEDSDLDAILRGRLLPVWQWVFRNVKSEDDMEIIRRNVRVARQQLESSKREREQAKEQRSALENRKTQLLEAVAQAKERERTLLWSMRTLESEDVASIQSLVDAKQRQVLRHAYNAEQDEAVAALSSKVGELKAHVTIADDDDAQRKLQSTVAAMKNPIAVLLSEYLRMLKAGDAEIVDFGDSDVAHLRDFGGDVLAQWLTELAATATSAHSGDAVGFADQEEAEYAAHVAENTSSSRDALTQVQQLLQRNQKEHIARFLETQALYARARQAEAKASELQQHQSSTEYDLWDNENDASSSNSSSRAAASSGGSDPQRLIADTVRLEVESNAQRAALDEAKRTHETLLQQIQASRQQKVDLDEKLELMRSFEQRQQAILSQLDAMHQQNQETATSMAARQEKLQRFASEHLQERYVGESGSGRLVNAWWTRKKEELRLFSASTTAVRPEQLDTAETVKVLQALRVPEYGGWGKVLSVLQQRDHSGETAARMLRERMELLRLQQPTTGDQTRLSTETHVQVLLSDIVTAAEALQTAAFPALEDIVATNAHTTDAVLVRLRGAIDDWFDQRGFSVQLQEADM